MKIVIASKGRSGTIGKQSLRWFPDALVLVDEAEAEDYEGCVPAGRLLTHPGLTTLSAIRNWILDHVVDEEDGVVVMADDDIVGLRFLVGWSPRWRNDPELIREVLETAAQCAIDAGCGIFGFNQNPNPLHFKPGSPFRLNTWVGTVFGFTPGHGLRFDEQMTNHQDVDVSLQALQKQRILWVDERWAFVNLRHTNLGGLTLTRTAASYEEAHRRLKAKWGRYVSFRTVSNDFRRKRKGLTAATTLMTLVRVPRRARGI